MLHEGTHLQANLRSKFPLTCKTLQTRQKYGCVRHCARDSQLHDKQKLYLQAAFSSAFAPKYLVAHR